MFEANRLFSQETRKKNNDLNHIKRGEAKLLTPFFFSGGVGMGTGGDYLKTVRSILTIRASLDSYKAFFFIF